MRKSVSLSAVALMTAGAAACSSATSTISNTAGTSKASSAPVSGTETITGQATGAAAVANNTSIPLTWRGPVNTTGSFMAGGNPPAKGQHHTFATKAGNFTVLVTSAPATVQKMLSAGSCQFEFATTVPYKADGAASTGQFAGATGSGAVVVSFRASLPKLANGKCNESNSAQPLTKGAVATFRGGGPLTIKP